MRWARAGAAGIYKSLSSAKIKVDAASIYLQRYRIKIIKSQNGPRKTRIEFLPPQRSSSVLALQGPEIIKF